MYKNSQIYHNDKNRKCRQIILGVKENVQILVEEYREERTEEDLGGFIALTDEEGIKELKENLLKNKIQ
mgnify:CR=1 FL=1